MLEKAKFPICYRRNYSHWWRWCCWYLCGADTRGRDNLHTALATTGTGGPHPGGVGGVRGIHTPTPLHQLHHLLRRQLDHHPHPLYGAGLPCELGKLSWWCTSPRWVFLPPRPAQRSQTSVNRTPVTNILHNNTTV